MPLPAPLVPKADVLVLATPVYFYEISAQMKTFIDRTYPIWQHLGKKEVYYIISAGLGEGIIERSLGDLNGFVEHLEEYKIAGKIYAANVMDAGLVKNQSVFQKFIIKRVTMPVPWKHRRLWI